MKKSARSKPRSRNKGVFAIALFEFAKAIAVLIATIAALQLLHKNVPQHVAGWIDMLRLDTDNRYIAAVLRALRVIHTKELEELAGLGFFYAALFLIEGVGLALEQRWAEWLTLVATGVFIPIEIYGLCTNPTALKALLLIANVVVVVFLALLVRQKNSRA